MNKIDKKIFMQSYKILKINILILAIGLAVSGCSKKDAEQTEKQIEMQMIFVQGGTFTMGCTSEQQSMCADDERPAHQVT